MQWRTVKLRVKLHFRCGWRENREVGSLLFFFILFTETDLNAPMIQASNCSTPGYVSYNIGDGTCYKYFPDLVRHYEAEIRCLQDHARLVSVNSSNTLTAVKALAG